MWQEACESPWMSGVRRSELLSGGSDRKYGGRTIYHYRMTPVPRLDDDPVLKRGVIRVWRISRRLRSSEEVLLSVIRPNPRTMGWYEMARRGARGMRMFV